MCIRDRHVDAPLADDRFISQEIIEQLAPILARLDHEVTLKVAVTNDDFGLEMKQFASEFAALKMCIRDSLYYALDACYLTILILYKCLFFG